MMRSWKTTTTVGLGIVIGMVVGSFVTLLLSPTMDEPDLLQCKLKPATLEDTAVLDAELVAANEDSSGLHLRSTRTQVARSSTSST